MTWPTVKVEAAFGDGPFAASKTWTDISDRVHSITAKHGRDSELGAFQAGNMTVRLDNSDRAFDPSYASGPYFGDLVPMVPIRAYFSEPSTDVPVVVDTFTRADDVSDLGAAETGGTWIQSSFGGTGVLGISSNAAYCSTVDAFNTVARVDSGEADGYVQASLSVPNGVALTSVFWRGDLGSVSVWQATPNTDADQIVLSKTVGGSYTQVDTAALSGSGPWLVRAEYEGSTIRVYVDGTLEITASDSALSTETEVGFTVNDSVSRVDDFESGTIETVTYPIGYGYVDGWPQEFSPPYQADVSLSCPDVFAVLANAPLEGGSPLAALIAADKPTHWYPLNDEAGSSFFTDLGSDAKDGQVYGSATPGFGAAGLDAGDPDATAWEADGTDAGYLNTRVNLGTSWDTIVFLVSHAEQGSTFLTRRVMVDQTNGVSVASGVGVAGKVGFSRNGDSAGVRTTVRVDDDAPHLVVARRVADGNWSVHVDGVADTPGSAGSPNFSNSPSTTCLGGISSATGNAIEGTLQHIAFFSTDQTGRAADYYAALQAWDEDKTGERLVNILDAVGHPTAERSIDTGTITLGPAEWSDTTRALPEAQAIEATEQGKLYQHPDGTLIFDQRHAWITATRSTTSQYTFSDDPTEPLHYERGITLDTGVTQIINVVTVTWAGGAVVVKDADSIDAYGPRDYQVTTAAPSAAVARSVGEYLISKYAEPILRVDQITLNPAANPDALWDACLDVAVGDRVTVERHPQEVGTAIVQESIVEAKAWQLDEGNNVASVVLSLSPADTTEYALWGDAGSVYDTAVWA